MKTKFLSLVLVAFLMISCQNDSDKDLTLRVITSSKLTVKVVDSKGNSHANVTVKLYDRAVLSSSSNSSSYSSLDYIYSGLTDANGKVDFGDIASGTYFILIDSIHINGLNYQPILQFQVNSNVDKNITINPEDYITTYNISVQKTEISNTNNMVSISAFKNLNVLFVPSVSYSTYYSLDKLISLAEVNGKTNEFGYVSVKAPAFRSYIAIAYNDTKTVFSQLGYSSYQSTSLTGDKGETVNLNYALDSKTLISMSYGTYTLSIKNPVSTSTTTSPTLVAFEGLNVAAIPSSVYDSSLPLSMQLESAELSGKTDATGNISFSLKSGINYQFVVYNNDQTKFSTLSASSYSSFYVSTGESKQTSFMINSITLTPVLFGRINLTFGKTSSVYYTPNPTDLTPFSNLKVALVPYLSKNSASSIDDLLAIAVASGTTDTNGQLSIVIPVVSSYNSAYYQIVSYNADKTAKFVSSSFSVYSGSSNTSSYYLNATSLSLVN